MSNISISTSVVEWIVDSGRRFGNAWAELKEHYKRTGRERDKWFDNMIIKLDSPTTEGFQKNIRKMIRTFYDEKGGNFKWNISTDVLSLISDKSKSYWRHAFITGVFFGYYGYFEKPKEEVNNE